MRNAKNLSKAEPGLRRRLSAVGFLGLPLYVAALGFSALLGGCGTEEPIDLQNESVSQGVGSADAPTDPTLCLKETQGGATSCKDEATWKSYGSMFCMGKKLTLKNITFNNRCGVGQFREATYECCGSSMPPPPPPPPPMMCSTETLATRSCLDDKSWALKAQDFCKSKMATVGTVSYGAACMGGHLDIKFQCCTGVTPPPPPPPPPPPTMCMWAPAMGAGTCRMPDAWKMEGINFCSSMKMELHDLKLDRACMTGGYAAAQYECCSPATPPPPPPPPPTMCTTETWAVMTCVDDVSWKRRAEDSCKMKGLAIKDLKLDRACATGHQAATLVCCPATPPPPPPPPAMCISDHLTSPAGVCMAMDAWKRQADTYCTSKKLALKDVRPGRSCGMTGYSDVTVDCCSVVTPPPPPPPPGMCVSSNLGGTTGVCAPLDAWKRQAEAFCSSKKLALKDVRPGKSCGMTGYSDVIVDCCPVVTPPPPPMCTENAAPAGACKTPDIWTREGTAFCAAKRATLSGISLDKVCGMGGFSEAKFRCCPTVTPPPPPPPACVAAVVGSPMMCVDEARLKAEADRTCTARGLKLTSFSAFSSCGAPGQFSQAKFECCK